MVPFLIKLPKKHIIQLLIGHGGPMKYEDNDLKELYENESLETFIEKVNPANIVNPRTRAIVAALSRSVRVLELEFNPIVSPEHVEKREDTNHYQEP
jgi:hypothetical protein